MIIDIIKVFLPAFFTFVVGIIITPVIADYLYRNKMWKAKAGKTALDGSAAAIFNDLHKDKEVGTPRMGGIVIWASVILTALLISAVSKILPSDVTWKLDFLSRSQTWLPLATLFFGAMVGLIDDILEVKGSREGKNGGLSLKNRLFAVSAVSLITAWWFYTKLDVNSLGLPYGGQIYLGPIFILVFLAVSLAIYAGGVIDGIDGLAGGIFASIFGAYAGIAFYQQQVDLAAFCAAVVGGILAFLWFNIPPARFYMSETGTMGLTITLTVVAFMTDKLGDGYGVSILPIVALPLVITVLSNLVQIASKKWRGKKIFRVAPLHHHFEAIGWPSYKVTMRYWIFGIVCAIIGMALALIG